jgi:L-threonine kinase
VAVAQCPASCGELIQGWILGSEKLVSCPVEWYSTVEVTSGSPLTDERPLSRAMVERLLLHWQYPAHMSQDIRIDVQSTIPVAKGMASSTADIAATAIATAQYLGHQLTNPLWLSFAFRWNLPTAPFSASLRCSIITTPPRKLPVNPSLNSICWFSKVRKPCTADYHRTPRQSGLLAAPQP